jgi:hypothetical protein
MFWSDVRSTENVNGDEGLDIIAEGRGLFECVGRLRYGQSLWEKTGHFRIRWVRELRNTNRNEVVANAVVRFVPPAIRDRAFGACASP